MIGSRYYKEKKEYDLLKATAKSHTHCQVARKVNHTSQNLSKSISLSTHWDIGWKKEVLATTRNIKNWAESGKYERINNK